MRPIAALWLLAACSNPFDVKDDIESDGSDTELEETDTDVSDTEDDATDTDGTDTETSDTETDSDGDGIPDASDYCPIQVDLTAPAGGDGSFAAPFQVIQDGIDAVPSTGCYEVEVHPGTYEETIDFSGYDVDVRAVDGPDVTTIDGGGSGPVVTIDSGEGSGARLYGFTVTGGVAARGAGLYIHTSDPIIQGNKITGNEASSSPASGGGLYLYDSEAHILDNEITGNEAGYGGDDDGNDGGGLTLLYGAPTVQGNLIQDNKAGDGGGIWVARADALILHNIIDGNEADDAGVTDDNGFTLTGQGGGIDFQADTDGTMFVNNIVTNNVAGSHGGGVAAIGYYVESDVAEPTIAYNVIAFNQTDEYGSGLCVWGIGAPTITGNIVAENDGTGVYSQYENAVITYNLSNGNDTNWDGEIGSLAGTDGNLGGDPRFVDATDDGDVSNDVFTLRGASPAVDAADPSETDADGSSADMGAYGGTYGSW